MFNNKSPELDDAEPDASKILPESLSVDSPDETVTAPVPDADVAEPMFTVPLVPV